MLTLYGDSLWQSPFVLSVFVALREKELAFDTKVLSLRDGEHRKPAFLTSSLTGKVPALDHDGFWLSESLAILEYLEEQFPPPDYPRIFPASITDRARARQVLNWLRTATDRLRIERPTSTIFVAPSTAPLSDNARTDADRTIQLVENLLPEGTASLFPEWSICDVELAVMLHRLIANGDAIPARVRAYAEANWSRPSVRAYVERDRSNLATR